MKRWMWACMFLAMGCGAKETNEIAEKDTLAKDTLRLAQAADSVTNTRIDGTETSADLPVDLKKHISQELRTLLDQQRPGWKFPYLSEAYEKRIPQDAQGPYFVQADFDGNKSVDFAVQLQHGDSVEVLALLNSGDNGAYKEYLLVKNPLQLINNQKGSISYLTLASKQARYYNYATEKNFSLKHDGIAVGVDNATVVFAWEKNGFKKYETGD